MINLYTKSICLWLLSKFTLKHYLFCSHLVVIFSTHFRCTFLMLLRCLCLHVKKVLRLDLRKLLPRSSSVSAYWRRRKSPKKSKATSLLVVPWNFKPHTWNEIEMWLFIYCLIYYIHTMKFFLYNYDSLLNTTNKPS